MKKIAIIGSTSAIALDFIQLNKDQYKFYFFCRNTKKMKCFLERNKISGDLSKIDENFELTGCFDCVINFVGVGDPGKAEGFNDIYFVTQRIDDVIIKYLKSNPEVLYIFISSGSAYGINFERPPNENSCSVFSANKLHETDKYSLAKFMTEKKHRFLKNYNICDLRIFNYVGFNQELNGKFLHSQLFSACIKNEELEVSSSEIFRDYLHPRDFTQAIGCVVSKLNVNDVFDVYSKKPISNYEIFDQFKKCGLKIKINYQQIPSNPTGLKKYYYSTNKKISEIGFQPQFSSLESLLDVYSYFQETKCY